MQQPVDPASFVERLVATEPEIRRVTQVDPSRHLGAQMRLVTGEGRDDRLLILAAERHYITCRQLEVGRHPDFRNGYDIAAERVILNLATSENLGQRMSNKFSNAQLAL